jgi:hypothetical protein
MIEIYFIHTTVLENLLENFRASYQSMCALFNIKYWPRVPPVLNINLKELCIDVTLSCVCEIIQNITNASNWYNWKALDSSPAAIC